MNVLYRLEPPPHEATRKPSPQAIDSSTIFISNAAEKTNSVEQLMIEIVVVARKLFERCPIDSDGRRPGVLELQSSVLSKKVNHHQDEPGSEPRQCV
jgi:hypothetical protein